ncbi:MAG: DUF3800 domain-containing protein [Candidatus Hydrogenedentes bacterium]|nr:DUF3800 domain-containing protein [Candidatus Hydrogenedentota bacterium]
MAWLLFLDESGHDHRQMPYEVRGGVALQDAQLWPFSRAVQQLERIAFGCALHEFQKEVKGSTLLDRKRFKFATQSGPMDVAERQKYCRAFFSKGLQRIKPSRNEFTAYGQACIEMARGIFQLLRDHKAVMFASAIPRGSGKAAEPLEEYLRKDQVFLLERFFYFLEREKQNGLLIMDETDKSQDRRFVRQLEGYFTKTNSGRYRTQWIVPTPFFVSSDLAYPIQAADLCIYCVNWAFRLPSQGMNAAVREEIRDEFLDWLRRLQFHGEGSPRRERLRNLGNLLRS